MNNKILRHRPSPLGAGALIVAGLSALVATSCDLTDVNVTRFDVEPKNICAGGEVLLSWAADNAVSTTIDQAPPPAPGTVTDPGPFDPNDSTRRTVATDTTFTLTATAPSVSDTETEFVTVVPAGGINTRIGSLGSCVDGAPKWRAAVAPAEWDVGVSVTTVVNTTSGDLNVAKGSTNLVLPPFMPSIGFNGEPIVGDWLLTPSDIPETVMNKCRCDAERAAARDRGDIGPLPISLGCGLTLEDEPGLVAIEVNAVCR